MTFKNSWNNLGLQLKFTIVLTLAFAIILSVLGTIIYQTPRKNHLDNTEKRMQAYTNELLAMFELNRKIKPGNQTEDLLNQIKNQNYPDADVLVISAAGKSLVYSNESFREVSSSQLFGRMRQIKNGQQSFIWPESGNSQQKHSIYFRYYEPGDVYLATIINENQVLWEPLAKIRNMILISIIAGIALLAFMMQYVMGFIIKPVNQISGSLEQLSKGIQINTHEVNRNDEIGFMSGSLNKLIEGLKETARFANEIEKRNFDYKFTPLSNADILGKALMDMRESLQLAQKEDEARKQDDFKRNWATEGLAKFSDILRMDSSNLEVLCFNIIKNLVKYLNINQGGLFVLNDENSSQKFLELKACYAYDRQKYLTKKIEIGEGITGSCYLEQETIYLKQIPQDYINITSGLGEASPNSLLVVPLKLNQQVFGVIELASFKEFQKYEIEFVEKIAESIASTLSSVKINLKTNQLLQQSQQQAEDMKSQEEEMRQNMEEMQATQEEMARKESEFTGLLKSINDSYLFAEFAVDGTLLSVNKNFLNLLKMRQEDMIGHKHAEFDTLSENPIEYKKFWEELKNGTIIRKDSETVFPDRKIWLSETYSPVIDKNGKISKVILLARDITQNTLQQEELKEATEEMKSQQEELRQNMEELLSTQEEMANKEEELTGLFNSINDSYLFAEFDTNGVVTKINDNFLTLFNVTRDEMIGQHHGDFDTLSANKEAYVEFWEKLNNGEIIKKDSETVFPDKTIWLHETYSPVIGKDGKISRLILLANDITEKKFQEIEIQAQSEELKSQQEELRQNLEEMQAQEEGLHNTIESIEKNKEESQKLKDHMAAMINNLPGIVYQCTADQYSTIDFISPYCEKITGYTPEDFISNKPAFVDLIHPEDLNNVNDTIKQAIHKKQKYHIEYRLKDKKGKYHQVNEHGNIINDSTGKNLLLQRFIFESVK
jgi:PAS domain S-box-containing protein